MKLLKKSMLFALTLIIIMSMAFNVGAAEAKDPVWTIKPSTDIRYLHTYIEGWGIGASKKSKPGMGIMDEYGNVIIPFEYSRIDPISSEYLIVCKNNQYGVIDRSNKEVIPFGKYGRLTKYTDKLLIANATNELGDILNAGLIDVNGKEVLPMQYEGLARLNDNLLIAYNKSNRGVIDKTGKVIIPIDSGNFYSLVNDKYLVCPASNNIPTGIIRDLNGKIIVEDENLVSVKSSFDGNIELAYRSPGDRYYYRDHVKYVDNNFKEIDTKGYEIADEINDKYLIAKKKNTDGTYGYKSGMVDKNFNIVIPFEYDALTKITDDILYANINEKGSVYVNLKGEPIEKLNKNIHIQYLGDGYIGAYTQGASSYGRYKLLDIEGNELLPAFYEEIKYFGNGIFAFKTISGRVGFAKMGGAGEKVSDYVDGLVLTIDSKKATVYGNPAENDVAPIIRDGRTMLPARFVAESLGGKVDWNEEKQQVTITPGMAGGKQIYLTIGSNIGKFGWDYTTRQPVSETLDVAPFVENDRTYTPVRFIAEKLGFEVEWMEETQTVKIFTK